MSETNLRSVIKMTLLSSKGNVDINIAVTPSEYKLLNDIKTKINSVARGYEPTMEIHFEQELHN